MELPELPTCNVFIRSEFRTQFYSIAEALEIHRLQQRPEIYNNPSAPVRLRLELNMSTEKAVSCPRSRFNISRIFLDQNGYSLGRNRARTSRI